MSNLHGWPEPGPRKRSDPIHIGCYKRLGDFAVQTWNGLAIEDLPGRIWQTLESASKDPGSRFRTAVLGTAQGAGCAVRTVVLRQVERESRVLICYSDVRTGKVRQIWQSPLVQWLFFDPASQVQIIAAGTAILHHADPVAESHWAAAPEAHQLQYISEQAPGSQLAQPGSGYPADEKSSTDFLQRAFDNFAVIATVIDSFDWLWLSADGNRRAHWEWNGQEYTGAWLVP